MGSPIIGETDTSSSAGLPWYERWFGEEYLDLYAHRDDDEASAVVDLVARATGWSRGDRILDLACGSGRHTEPFASRGGRVAGLDLSIPLLRRARDRGLTTIVRGDIRVLPFADRAFQLVVNLFTSFGYFEDDGQHQTVLDEVRRVLRAGGHLVLDFLNAARVRRNLVREETRELNGRAVRITRRITPDDRFIVKTIDLVDDGRSYDERVRLFSPDELRTMLGRAGLDVVASFGDYAGGSLRDDGDRAIHVARRT